ncbi:MAG: BREX system Lon protease-like protein BrxL, partial [Candidatus Brockarchaeota archaeon]|nr:BREX system Lon protease-like protein BrxL [Candidatus Brockarchaeota archaeon]
MLTENYVHPDQAELLKSKVKEHGRYRVIDKVKVKLHETEDKYWAELVNLQLNYVNISEDLIRRYERLLGGGLWGIIDLSYNPEIIHKGIMRPFVIEHIRPIQLEVTALEDLREKRSQSSKDEWIDFLIRSIGLEPSKLDYRLKMLNICRLIPFVENNYNLVELGPRGTGKSYVYRELSPYSILVSGGETTVAGLFIDMRGRGRMGLVMLWDVVAFDEVAGLRRLKDAQAVQILKDYMETRGFARIREEFKGTASLVFIGNIDYDIPELLSIAHLFVPFPLEMQDAAFFDRFHAYIPGWEIPRMRSELLTDHYGFVIDYFATIVEFEFARGSVVLKGFLTYAEERALGESKHLVFSFKAEEHVPAIFELLKEDLQVIPMQQVEKSFGFNAFSLSNGKLSLDKGSLSMDGSVRFSDGMVLRLEEPSVRLVPSEKPLETGTLNDMLLGGRIGGTSVIVGEEGSVQAFYDGSYLPAVVTASPLGLQLGLLARPSGEALTIDVGSLVARGIQDMSLLNVVYPNGETSTVIYTGGNLQIPPLSYPSGAFVGVQAVETKVVWTGVNQREFYGQIAS